MLRITRHPPPTKWRGVLTDPIWIYRGLMRQTRALYDDVAREYFRQYIRRMFIGHKYVEQNTRLVTYIREARQGILLLARANAGYIGPLSKVLDLAYGRIGKRRHELLEVGLLLGVVAVAVAVAVVVLLLLLSMMLLLPPPLLLLLLTDGLPANLQLREAGGDA